MTGLFLGAAPALAQHGGGRGGGGHGSFAPPPARGPSPMRQAAPPHATPPPPREVAPPPSRAIAPPPSRTIVAPPPSRGVAPPPSRTVAPPPLRPHVERGANWVGHDSGRDDARFHVGAPFPHGHFSGGIGRRHVYNLGGWDPGRHRFSSGGYYFGVASWEWDYSDDWEWNSDRIVLYDDPDHEGWLLAYNVRLGTYVHVQYDGRND